MASPQQRPDPNEPRRDYEDLQRARMERRSAAGAGFAWWWFFWIIIIGLAIWWAGWGWGGTGGWWWGGRARTAPTYGTSNAAPGTNNGTNGNGVAGNPNAGYGANQAAISGPGLSALTATNKQPYIGKHFQVNDVPVQNKVNNHVLWIGAHNSTPMLVVLTGNGNTAANVQIGQGSRIDVTGTVQKAPPQAQAKQRWSLSDDDAAQLEREGAYIQATQAHTVQP